MVYIQKYDNELSSLIPTPTHVKIADVDAKHMIPELDRTVVSVGNEPRRVNSGDVTFYPREGRFQVDEVSVGCTQGVV